ncbi:hypothetical protein SAMN04488074_13628 [Lentzea albidocapillata subsp. violacea]|uniref:Uncharacterized protein n=1 Tax=Lentzea albidocapillata subsp. violacea TaxID=128104 RepID=A0A1G9YYF3_9PSEU|nr:hypothetical protein [Lentzea albidocapillata]SDN14084.1 hypothetical protein SAMN04488074_13628 [Lentzea albidocapillata subsp. violacea]
MSGTSIVVDPLDSSVELDNELDALRRLGFRPIAVPCVGYVPSGVVNALALHENGVANLFVLLPGGDAQVTRAVIVDDRSRPSTLLNQAFLFRADAVVVASWTREVIEVERRDMAGG